MTPWEVIKRIFNKATPLDEKFPVLFIIKLFSCDNSFIKYCNKMNYFFRLNDNQWFKLLRVCFGGRGKYLGYNKKLKQEKNKLFDEFRNKVKLLYNWSDREFGYNYDTLKRHINDRFLQGLGFNKREMKLIVNFLAEK
jgi:hypothetical protein